MSDNEGYMQHSANDTKTRRSFKEYRSFVRNEWVMVLSLLAVGGLLTLGAVSYAGGTTKSFTAVDDAYVDQSQPTKNFSKIDDLAVQDSLTATKTTYLKFNVSGINGKVVKSAKLHIRERQVGASAGGDIYTVTGAPSSFSNLNWNNHPKLDSVQKIGTIGKTSPWVWYNINLSKTSWTDGTVTLAIAGTSSQKGIFSSINSGSKPQLVFETGEAAIGQPAVSLHSSQTTSVVGGNVVLDWSVTNNPATCTATGDWSGAKAASGQQTVGPLATAKTYVFALSCTNEAGSDSATTSVVVSGGSGGGTPVVRPVVAISARPTTATVGSATTLTWSSTNSPTGCNATGDWSGSKATSGSQAITGLATAKTYSFVLTCMNSAGSGVATATVAVSDASGGPGTPVPPPTVPPTGNQVVGVPYVCNGPVNNLTVRGTGSNSKALVELASGCTGSLNFDVTITSGGGDGVKVQGGAHDLNIGTSRIVCQAGTSASFHQDGVQVQGGNNVTFHNLTIICPYVYGQGAAGFYIDGKDFNGINNVVCDGCNLEHYHYGAMFTGPAPNSGVRNSIIHQGLLTHGYYAGSAEAPVNTGNTLAPACNGEGIPC